MDPNDLVHTQPLGRSGLDVLDVLAVTDEVAVREATGSVAREVGLEQARGSLLRNQPGEALASLDVIWEGAQQSEEGWYLRSGALTALGLPGESERVADEGLALRPSSMALRFMQSFARLTLGDLAGARTVLQPALDRAPADPLLLVQRALVQAKQGDPKGADAQLQELAAQIPDHPAVMWGRAMLRAISADAARQRARPTPIGNAALPNRGVDVPAADVPATDVATAALGRFGVRIATRPTNDTVSEARMLMRAFSAGGALATAVTAEHAHAARIVLTTYLGVATGEGAESPAPLRSLVAQVIPLLQEGRVDEAERLVRRQSLSLREPLGRLLLAVVRGAYAPDAFSVSAPSNEAPLPGGPLVRSEAERGALVPVRLGLGLLEETPASRVALDGPRAAWTATGLPFGVREDGTVVRYMMSGSMNAVPSPTYGADLAGEGWGAAQAAASAVPAVRIAGAGVQLGVVLFFALAVGALATGHWFAAIGLGLGAAWLGLHRRRRHVHGDHTLAQDEHEGTQTHDGSSSQ